MMNYEQENACIIFQFDRVMLGVLAFVLLLAWLATTNSAVIDVVNSRALKALEVPPSVAPLPTEMPT